MPSRKDGIRAPQLCPCLLKAKNKARRNKLIINKKIIPVEKTKRTVLGIFGKFVADLFDMPIIYKTGVKVGQLLMKP